MSNANEITATVSSALFIMNKRPSPSRRLAFMNARYTRFSAADVREVARYLGLSDEGSRADVLWTIVNTYEAGSLADHYATAA